MLFKIIRRSNKIIDKIKIQKDFKENPPKSDKLITKTADYMIGKDLPPIIIDKDYNLIDGYCSYLIAKALGVKTKIIQMRDNQEARKNEGNQKNLITNDKKLKHSKIKTNQIEIKYHNPELVKIEKIEIGDWIDLRAAEDVVLKAGESKIVSLGVSMKLPKGYEAHIVPRSSSFKNWGIIQTNHMGIIDNSYSGNNDIWGMPVYATRDTEIKTNDRICQFRIVRRQPEIEFVEVEELKDADRGGFGSTGK